VIAFERWSLERRGKRSDESHRGSSRSGAGEQPAIDTEASPDRQNGATERSLTQLPWNPNGTRWGSGTRAT
jgi:hypothetical protein